MKKKILAGVIAICMAFGSAALLPENTFIDSANISASAESTATSGKCGENVNWVLDNGVLTISGTGPMYDYSFEDSPFYYRTEITTLIIENGVTSIGSFAFESCSNLTSIDIPNSVTSIGGSAFYDCENLASVAIPSSVTSIGDRAFMACSGLSSVEIPGSVKVIDTMTFSMCSKLTNVTLHDGLTTIRSEAFGDCKSLSSISIPSTVTEIRSLIFNNCSSLTEITVDDNNSVFSSYDGALYDKSKTQLVLCPNGKTAISFPKGVKNIGESAFSNCHKLSSAKIPNGVTAIGNGAFYDCTGLKDITIPDSVNNLGSYAFSGCDSLTTVTVPNGVTKIPYELFGSCDNLKSVIIPNSVTLIDEKAFYYCDSLTDVIIPNSVTSIGNQAFFSCNSLRSICIPNGVTKIGDNLFDGCESLTDVNIPSTVTSIGRSAFRNCKSLKCLIVPSSVTEINSFAFYDLFPSEAANITICALKGTAAEKYAEDYNIAFTELATRLAGANRYDTAAKISQASFEKADTVYLASGLNYADALAAVPLAADDSPILLTSKNLLSDDSLAEIKRLEAKNVIILGGEGAISKTVENKLKAEGLNTSRIAGKNRFETATKIAEKVTDKPEDVFFVYYNGFADALSASAVAAVKNAPIIYLPTKGELNAETAAYLKELKNKNCVKNAYVIGGSGVISDDMANKAAKALGLKTATRVAGKDRFETCLKVNRTFEGDMNGNMVCVATGMDFPDALAGGVYAAKNKAPLFLINSKTKTATLSENQTAYLKAKAAGNIVAFGGTGAVSDKYLEEITKCSK